jgi:hypothetical protein
MPAVEEQEPIQAHRANHPREVFRDTVCLPSANGVRTLSIRSSGGACHNAQTFDPDLESGSGEVPGEPPTFTSSCLACGVSHGPLGLGVHPRMHASSAKLDDEEHVEGVGDQDHLQIEEIAGEQASGGPEQRQLEPIDQLARFSGRLLSA